VIYRGREEPNVRFVNVIPRDEPEKFSVLVVEDVVPPRAVGPPTAT
jgi:hypothetical protein